MSNGYKKILVPVDGSVLADLAYQKAKRHAAASGAELFVLSVVDTSGITMHDFEFGIDLDPVMEASNDFLKDYAADAEKDHIKCTTFSAVGSAKNVILETVKKEHADAIFMGSSGTNSLTRLIAGSTTDFIVRHASVDVLVVKTHMDNHTRPTH